MLRATALRAPVLRGRRRSIMAVAAVLAGVLVIVTLVAGLAGGGESDVTYVDGRQNAVLYKAGHLPMAPDFSGTTLTGSPLSFSSYRGRVVVLNFWASWCVPCREEASTMASVAALYRSAGVTFLGVDQRDTTASADAFVRGFGVAYPSVSDPSSTITADFSAVVPSAGTPTTLVIDASGHIAGAVFGSASYSELTTILAKVTGKNAVA